MYKRQSITVIILQIGILYIFTLYYKAPIFYMTLALITSTAVSYTHLDVYKRQAHREGCSQCMLVCPFYKKGYIKIKQKYDKRVAKKRG